MAETLQMWDRLAGELVIYVENYLLSLKSDFDSAVKPSYAVDYEISDKVLAYLKKSIEAGDINEIWQHKIAECRDVKTLPNELQELVGQFLPLFLSRHSEYRRETSLKGEAKNGQR